MNAWLRVCGLLAIGSAAVAFGGGFANGPQAHPLAWQADAWLSRPWTLWTAAWVHPSAGSLLGNLLAVGALAVLGAWLRLERAAAAALVIAWPLSMLGLLLWPEVLAYAGLGAPIHAAAMVVWAQLAFRPDAKPLSFALFAGMALKLLAEQAWLQPVGFEPAWGVNVVVGAHLTGAAAGMACGVVAVLAAGFRK
ncbi:MAG: hypothetical protein EOO25_17365 [Comamonadaceae bacterium]|nr:MAG: hypothetical protein EOO25_17365 [Comamonadaceae bacterium]